MMFGRRKQTWVLAFRSVGSSEPWKIAASSTNQIEVARWARQHRRSPLAKKVTVEAITAEEFLRWNEEDKP